MGERIRKARKGPQGREDRNKQEALAEAVGISRSTLVRIERGLVVPRWETLERLMHALDLNQDAIAVRKDEGTSHRSRVSRRKVEKDDTLGAWPRKQRQEKKLTIAEVAAAAGVAPSQISRIERAQISRSRLIGWHPEHAHFDEDERRRILENPVLFDLHWGVWLSKHAHATCTSPNLR